MKIEYGTTSDGLKAARLGDVTYAVRKTVGGELFISHAYDKKPLSELKASDFFGHEGRIDSYEAFVADMEDRLKGKEQVNALGRFDFDSKTRTPWGQSQGGTVYVEKGIYKHHTAGHGGFKVYKNLNDLIPEPYRNDDGWYEEDSEWAKVAVSFPAYFSEREVRLATETVKNWDPDAYEAVTGEVLADGESFKKDERLFKERHVNDWLVISAIGETNDDGEDHVRCVATIGGKLSRNEPDVGWIEEEHATFSVPPEEYRNRGRYGFAIDPVRHPRLDEAAPSMRM